MPDDVERVRSHLLERLATPQADTRFYVAYLVRPVAEQLEVHDWVVHAAIWSLVGDGLVYLDPAGQESAGTLDNWRWRLSPKGIAAATGTTWEPANAPAYLQRLRARSPGLDLAAETYVREALGAYGARCYLASSVMLGVAAEHVFERVAAAFVRAFPDGNERLAELLADERSTHFRRLAEFRKRFEPRWAEMPADLADAIVLDAVADLLRVTRNEAGHPTGRTVDEETAYTHLNMAGILLARMTDLAEHLEGLV